MLRLRNCDHSVTVWLFQQWGKRSTVYESKSHMMTPRKTFSIFLCSLPVHCVIRLLYQFNQFVSHVSHPFFLTLDLFFSQFVWIFEIFWKCKKSCDWRIDWIGTVIPFLIWQMSVWRDIEQNNSSTYSWPPKTHSVDQLTILVLQGPVRRTRMGPRTGPDCNRFKRTNGPGPSNFFWERQEKTMVLRPVQDRTKTVGV